MRPLRTWSHIITIGVWIHLRSIGKEEYCMQLGGCGSAIRLEGILWNDNAIILCRVWYTTRVTGTHTKELSVFGKKFKPTGKTVLGGPEQQSLVFNEKGQVRIFTGGELASSSSDTTEDLQQLLSAL